MTSSYLLLFVSACLIVSISAQQACPSISITQTLRTTWLSDTETFYLYDITATNTYDVDVSNIIFVVDSLTVAQSWNLVQLPGSDSTPFTFVQAGATSALTLAPGQSWTGSGFVSQGVSAPISGEVTCTGPAAAASSSDAASSSSVVASSESSTSAPSSSSDNIACSSTMEFGLELETAPAPTWNDSTFQYSEFTFRVLNTGSATATSTSVSISFNTAFGSVDRTWNMEQTEAEDFGATFTVTLFALAPGQTFSSAGIIFKVPLSLLGPDYHQGHYDYPYALQTISTQC